MTNHLLCRLCTHFFLILSLLFIAFPAYADSFTVTTLADSGVGSLRQAILDANATPGADTISFTLTGTITLSSSLPTIDDDLSITGWGSTQTILQGNGTFQLLNVSSATSVTLAQLRLTGGGGFSGGAISNGGTLTLQSVTLDDNHTDFFGGALENTDTLFLYDSVIHNNSAAFGSGALENLGTVTIQRSAFYDNSSDSGGAIGNGGTMSIHNSTLSSNSATGFAGAIYNSIGGTLSLNHVTLTLNNALGTGGGLTNISSQSSSASIVLGNTGTSGNEDCSGSASFNDVNLLRIGTGCPVGGTDISTSAVLSAILNPTLDTHGSTIPSHAIVTASPALNVLISCSPSTDQRLVARPQDGACELGAFEVIPPTALSFSTPTGHITDDTPLYTWNKAPYGAWYHVWVYGGSVSAGYWGESGVSVTCDLVSCSWELPLVLPEYALYSTWVQHWGALYGYGDWSAAQYFVLSKVPDAPIPANPHGAVSFASPDFLWDHVDAAEWYYLWLSDDSSTVADVWYNAYGICDFVAESCTVDAATHGLILADGAYTWWLQAWSPIGYGAWSAGQSFTVMTTPVIAPSHDGIAPMVLPASEIMPIAVELP